MSSTIAAIATAQAAAGIGIIRISGCDAKTVADKVFRPVKVKNLQNCEGYTAYYGKIIDNDEVIDEAIALVFVAPYSYTGEDVVELSCHGGLFLLQKILDLVLKAGAVLANAGEFTQRAYLNGKIDLTQAESVMNIISAQAENAAKAALAVREGILSNKIQNVKKILLTSAAHMSVWADYPEEDIEVLEKNKLLNDIKNQYNILNNLLINFDAGKVIREGVKTAIVGRPNVGKSTLMNFLSGENRSIVTPIAGTTRDVVEETVKIGNIILHLADTAGIRSTEDIIEKIGVEKSRQLIENSQLILAVFDSSAPLNDEDLELLKSIINKNAVAILNKTDLEAKTSEKDITKYIKNIVSISAHEGTGRSELEDAISDVLGTANLDPSSGILATQRQKVCCEKAVEALKEAIDALEMGITLDAVNVCVDYALEALMELTGERVTNEVSDEVFSKFCVGK